MAYTYDAAGNKLRKVSGSNSTDYISGIQYDNGSITFVQTEEGRVLNPTGTPNYEYSIADHLGNSRVNFDSSHGGSTATQVNDYYPFGLTIQPSTTSPPNYYLYNKKELQPELAQYDYGARFYDPVIGRWTSVDPLAETFENTAPYGYVLNNPIKLIDPDGRDTSKVLKEVTITASKKNDANVTPVILPRLYQPRPIRLPRFTAIPAPNPFLLALALIFTPANSLSDHSETDALHKIHLLHAMLHLTVDDLINDSEKIKIRNQKDNDFYQRPGGMDQADKDFDSLNPSDVKPIPGGRVGKLPDGTPINVRDRSTDGRPTLEVDRPGSKIKIRYDK